MELINRTTHSRWLFVEYDRVRNGAWNRSCFSLFTIIIVLFRTRNILLIKLCDEVKNSRATSVSFVLKYANASSSRSECIEMLRYSCAAERILTTFSVRHAARVSRNLFSQKTHQTFAGLTTRKNQWKCESTDKTCANCAPRAYIFTFCRGI